MNFLAFTGLINSLFCFTAAVFILCKNIRHNLNVLFSSFCFSIGFYNTFYFLWQQAGSYNSALNYFKFLFIGIVLINALFLHFVVALLNSLLKKRWILFLSYGISIVFIFLNLKLILYTHLAPRFDLGLWPVPTIYFDIYLAFWFIQILYGFYLLIRFLSTSVGKNRNDIKYFSIAAAFGFLGGATNWFIWYNIYFPPYLNILISVYLSFIVYTVFKHQLLGINIFIRKTLGYTLVISLFFIISVMLLFLLNCFFGQLIPQQTIWFTLVIVAILALIFQPLYHWSISQINKCFFKGTLPEISKEKERIEEELKRSERLASIGMLASGLLHEIKNPLSPIKAKIELLPEYLTADQKSMDFFQKINTAIPYEIDRINNLLKQLKEFADPSQLTISQNNVIDILEDRLYFLDEILNQRKIEVIKDYKFSNMTIFVDPNKLSQVFLNLFQNAIDSMPQGGTLNVSYESSTIPISNKNAILIRIQDTGFGMCKEDLAKIFDPFFTKKKSGTGLGLTVSHQIIKKHNGIIHVESEQGEGTTFFVYLPI